MERLCSTFVRKWLGVPPAFSSVNLSRKTSKLRLPVSSVVEEFKATKARAVSTLLPSEDGKARHANKTIKSGRKWKPQEAVMDAEAHWKHQVIVGVVCQGRLGLGNYNAKRWSKANAKGKRGLVVQRVRETVEEDRCVKAVGLACQGQWMQWDQALERSLSWKELWEVTKWVDQQRVKANKNQASRPKVVNFISEGDKAPRARTTAKNLPSILQRASDWEMQVDLKRKLVFPQDVAVTSLWPDMVLLSRSTKTMLVAELTVPWEGRLAISHQLKRAKYQDLIDEALIKGWHATVFPIEVGCPGFPTTSVCYFLQKFGLGPKHLKIATREIAETSSRWLWSMRAHSWNPSAGEG
ncbi:hypothetical protein SKAU_G00373630 [Synaphobranchus kaupii]|uniref:Uncharacterized protein n=1 Tax=Synaphobranchus kaupii TaxID=118154 RepID=A0A9Q1EGH9_SYNKA|nr:hypothetical protein SKAU_G00373630 [Synaphobranchus kaupii]